MTHLRGCDASPSWSARSDTPAHLAEARGSRAARIGVAVLVAFALSPPVGGIGASAWGQTDSVVSDVIEHNGGRVLVSFGGGVTSVRSQSKLLVGGEVRVRLPGSYSAGTAAWVATAAVPVPGGSTGVDYQMNFAYWGIVTERRVFRTPRADLGARLTLGAGSARMALPGATGYSAADNFGVVLAEGVVSRRMARVVELRVLAGYRAAFGVEDLPQTIGSHFEGPSLSLAIALGAW